jgi:hypothetical protein
MESSTSRRPSWRTSSANSRSTHPIGRVPAPLQEKARRRVETDPLQPGAEALGADGAPAFPTHVLPAPVRRFVEEGAAGIPCPPDFLGVPALVVLGSAIGTTRELELRPGWRERASFLAAIVADPGARKSPALALATRPLVLRQQELMAHHEAELEGYHGGAALYEVNLSAWRSAKKQALMGKGEDPGEMPVRPEEPVLRQISTTDVTVEALAVLLARNPRGIVVPRDELTAWTRSMNAYRGGLGADRQAWLSLWSGAAITINRKSEPGPIIVERPMVSVVGCLPPDVLGELSDERGREDGFLHRLLFAFPAGVRLHWTEQSISSGTLEAYCEVYARLSSLAPHVDGGAVVTGFTPAGKSAFVRWVTGHYEEMERVETRLRGPWAKLEAYVARLALVIQEIRFVVGEARGEDVDDESVGVAGTPA